MPARVGRGEVCQDNAFARRVRDVALCIAGDRAVADTVCELWQRGIADPDGRRSRCYRPARAGSHEVLCL